MERVTFIILLLLFIFTSLPALFSAENAEESVLESARKVGFEQPAEGLCPSCKVEIVVDLSAETSQCPYCKEIFLSESAVKRIANKEALPYTGSMEVTTSESADKGVLKEIVYDEKYGDTPKGFYLYISFDDSLSKRAEIDLSKVFDEYQKTKDLDKELQRKGNIKQEQREKLVREIREMQKKNYNVDAKVKNLMEFDEIAKAELTKERDDMVRDVLIDINDVIQEYGKENKYKAIYNNVWSHCREKDITNKIIKMLNSSSNSTVSDSLNPWVSQMHNWKTLSGKTVD